MKFGKFLQSQQAEWAGAGSQFMNYKALKKIINSLATIDCGNDTNARESEGVRENSEAVVSKEIQAIKTSFFYRLERELEKVNAFYLQKETEFRIRLRSLVDKKRVRLARLGSGREVSSLENMKEAFLLCQQELDRLQKFVELNATGFRKILKKWDKRSKSSMKEIYLSRQIEIQPCFNSDVLAALNDMITVNLSELEQLIDNNLAGIESNLVTTATTSPLVLQNDPSPSSINAVAMKPLEKTASVLNEEMEAELVRLLCEQQSAPVKQLVDMRGGASTSQQQLTTSSADGAQGQFYSRAFWRSCTESNAESLAVLLKTNLVDLNYADDIADRTCLHETAISGNSQVMKLCLEHAADVEATDIYGRTPLHYVAMHGNHECASFLLSLGAKQVLDHDGFSPLVYAVIGGHASCTELFLEHGAIVNPTVLSSPNPLALACQYGHLEIATLLLQRGAQIVSNAEGGLHPLHLTCREGHFKISQLLIDHGADVNVKDGFSGWTPIFYAASEGHLVSTKLLLSNGCDITVRDEYDWLPWTYALYRGHIELARLLVINEEENVNTDVPTESLGDLALDSSLDNNVSGTVVLDTDSVNVGEIDLKPMAPSGLFGGLSGDSVLKEGSGVGGNGVGPVGASSMDLGSIPSLSLPPPIIPFRIYGHNYLDKKFYVQITLSSSTSKKLTTNLSSYAKPTTKSATNSSPIVLFSGNRQLSSLKLVISTKPESGIPHNVMLPLKDPSESFSFLVDDIDPFTLQFDIYPTFGTKVIGHAVIVSSMIQMLLKRGGDREKCIVPLYDALLRCVGELRFELSIIKPFVHPRLAIGGAIDTYWKSTKTVNGGTGLHSFVTASSLAEEYIVIVVQVTQDGVPVVYPHWGVEVAPGVSLGLSTLKFEKAKQLVLGNRGNNTLGQLELNSGKMTSESMARFIESSFMTLEQVLQLLPSSIGLNVEIKYPTPSEAKFYGLGCHQQNHDINSFTNIILQTIYDHSDGRSIIFSSFNPSVCTALTWKQPNYAVFFASRVGFGNDVEVGEKDPRCKSIKEAIRFARNHHLLGVFLEVTPLIQVPVLIQTVKESGLLLATFGELNRVAKHVAVQEKNGVDAIIVNNVFRAKNM